MKKFIVSITTILLLSSCVSSLSDSEKREYAMYKKKNYEIETKNKYVGAGLGLLPGGGSFYSGHVMIGLGDLLLWPFSILWDPLNGYNGSEKINYSNTKEFVSRKKETEIRDLTTKFEAGTITEKNYIIEKQKIEDKYSPNI